MNAVRSQRPVAGDALDFCVGFRSYIPLFRPARTLCVAFVHRLGLLYLLPYSNSCLATVYTVILVLFVSWYMH